MTAEQIAELVLRYLDVLLRWPVAIVILGLTGMVMFKKPLSDFFSRVVSARGYGFQVNAAPQTETASVKKPETPEFATIVEEQSPTAQAGAPPIPPDAIQYVKQHPVQAIEEYLRAFNGYRYEKAFNILYGTQIAILEHLTLMGEDGELYINLAPYYEEFRRRLPGATYQMPDYIRYLQTLGFIEYVGDPASMRVRITPSGLGFVSYIRAEYPLAYDKRAF